MEESTKQRGGKREGAGRKPKIAKNVTFGANQEVADILASLDCNKNDFINAAILAYAKTKK